MARAAAMEEEKGCERRPAAGKTRSALAFGDGVAVRQQLRRH